MVLEGGRDEYGEVEGGVVEGGVVESGDIASDGAGLSSLRRGEDGEALCEVSGDIGIASGGTGTRCLTSAERGGRGGDERGRRGDERPIGSTRAERGLKPVEAVR